LTPSRFFIICSSQIVRDKFMTSLQGGRHEQGQYL
jgi:hypothetical protein